MADAAFGVVVRGAGPVGLAFALFLLREGFPPDAIELADETGDAPDWLGARPLALGHGSWQLLGRVCQLPDAAPIERVEVSLEGHAGRTHLDARDAGQPALGRVVRHRDLVAALRRAATGRPFARPDGPALDPARSITVVADGDTGDDALRRDFDQVAVLAELTSGVRDNGTAFERFTADGPLALLPLARGGRHALVWCGTPDQAARRVAAPEPVFLDELATRFGRRFDPLALASPRASAPLARRTRTRLVDGQSVWIGNAAQALHPVAGQGLNLGLRDAFVLARCLGDARAAGGTLAQGLAALQRHAGERRLDRQALVGITDTLASVFTLGALRPLQSVALAALDLAGPLRDRFAARLMYGFR